MPQPLSRVKPGARVFIDPAALSHFPKLAMLAMTTLALGAQVDSIAGRVLSALLRSDLAVGLAMYEALVSADAKRAALEGAARVAVSQDDFKLLRAVMSVTKAARDRRNDFAHHLWGWSPDINDALLLVDPRVVLRSNVTLRNWSERINEELRSGATTFATMGEPPEMAPPEDVMVYREADLETAAQEGIKAVSKWRLLDMAFRQNRTDDQVRPQLLSDPQIQRAIERMSNEGGP